jgi:hypothetical protein
MYFYCIFQSISISLSLCGGDRSVEDVTDDDLTGNVSRHSIFTNVKEINTNPHMILSFRKNYKWDLSAMFCY